MKRKSKGRRVTKRYCDLSELQQELARSLAKTLEINLSLLEESLVFLDGKGTPTAVQTNIYWDK